jgi:hypothetical protein
MRADAAIILNMVTPETIVQSTEIGISKQLDSSTLINIERSSDLYLSNENPSDERGSWPEGFLFSPPLWGSGYPQDLQ